VWTGESLSQPGDAAYNAGYSACADEALRHIEDLDTVSYATRQRLITGLSTHLRQPRRFSTDHDDVTTTCDVTGRRVTSPTRTCDVTQRRLFGGTCDVRGQGQRQRRPLAEIQQLAPPSVGVLCRDPPPVSRSTAVDDCCRHRRHHCPSSFQIRPEVTSSNYSSHVTPAPPTTQLIGRRLTLTQTMTTTLHEDQHQPTTLHTDLQQRPDLASYPSNISGHVLDSDFRSQGMFSSANVNPEPMWRPWWCL